jgi:phosphatidylglycerol:prolipoprotein diacylglycerol transferase
VINIRNGGLAIHGGLIFGIIVVVVICRIKKINPLNMLDLFIPSVALAQAIGRWGNFFNGEAHGGPTDLPWAILVDGQLVHPTFLYESVWCLILFFALSWFDKKKRTAMGQTLSLYLIFYSLERFFVEALRTDSLMIGPFKQAQVISLCAILFGIFLYKYSSKHFPLDQ